MTKTEKFTASNDVEIEVGEGFSGDTYLTGKEGGRIVASGNMDGIKALREFFLQEEEKKTPYSVVEGEYVIARFHSRERAEEFVNKLGHGYMQITPEKPKPWHDAKPGEVWVITTENVADEVAVQVTPELRWQYNDGATFARGQLEIVTAFRIWPEGDKK